MGSIAEQLDVSCMAFEPYFPTVQEALYKIWDATPYSIHAIFDLLHVLNPPIVLSQHFFQPNPVTGTGVSPVWDFRSNPRFKDEDGAYFLGQFNGSIPSPRDPTRDAVWLHIANVQGQSEDEVFRFDTVGGQPPTSVSLLWCTRPVQCVLHYSHVVQCKYGTDKDISVKYVTKYGESSRPSSIFESAS